MIFAPLRSCLEQSRLAFFRLVPRVDAVCARLNPGLAAFATTLMLVVVVLWVARHPEMSRANGDASAAAAGLVE